MCVAEDDDDLFGRHLRRNRINLVRPFFCPFVLSAKPSVLSALFYNCCLAALAARGMKTP